MRRHQGNNASIRYIVLIIYSSLTCSILVRVPPITFTRMFEPRHNIFRTFVRTFESMLWRGSNIERESKRSVPGPIFKLVLRSNLLDWSSFFSVLSFVNLHLFVCRWTQARSKILTYNHIVCQCYCGRIQDFHSWRAYSRSGRHQWKWAWKGSFHCDKFRLAENKDRLTKK